MQRPILFVTHPQRACGVHQFGLQILDILSSSGRYRFVPAAVATVGDLEEAIAAARPDAMLVNWLGSGGTITPHLMHEVLDMDDAEGRGLFAGKAVIIGIAGWDEWLTSAGPMPGPEIQANALNTLVSGRFVNEMNRWLFLVLLVVCSALSSVAVRRLRGWRSRSGKR